MNPGYLAEQEPRCHQAVAAIVSFAAEHGNALRQSRRELAKNGVGDMFSCVFHQLQAGDAVALGGESIDFSHLGSSESFHGRLTAKSKHPAAADIDDLSGNVFGFLGCEKSHRAGKDRKSVV